MSKMHPFFYVLTVALAYFFWFVYNSSDLSLFTKLTLIGACGLIQASAIFFESYRLEKERQMKEKGLA